MKKKNLPIMFFGHHKGATETLRQILIQVSKDLGLKYAHYASPRDFGGDLKRAMRDGGVDAAIYTNAEIEHVKPVPFYRGFHMIRDPRDIIVSAYFSHKKSHPTEGWTELPEHRKKLEALSQEEGLFAEMEFSARLPTVGQDLRPLYAMGEWNYSMPNVREIRFEDFILDPYETILSALEFLGLVEAVPFRTKDLLRLSGKKVTAVAARALRLETPLMYHLPRWRVLELVYDHGFRRQTKGRAAGTGSESHHLRKGVPGDWVNYFSTKHAARFKELFPGLVSKLGYEADETWNVPGDRNDRGSA